jgi:putative addiction module killer protein
MYSLVHYRAADGDDLFAKWIDSLQDIKAQARIAARLLRLENGNFGDCRSVDEGVWELRIDWGPGYRVYYAVAAKRVILLCEGGDKRTQKADIKRAQARWSDWKSRMKHGRGS